MSEIECLKDKSCTYKCDRLTAELAEAKAALQKFEGAVEVETTMEFYNHGKWGGYQGRLPVIDGFPEDMIGQPVTVWVKRREG